MKNLKIVMVICWSIIYNIINLVTFQDTQYCEKIKPFMDSQQYKSSNLYKLIITYYYYY